MPFALTFAFAFVHALSAFAAFGFLVHRLTHQVLFTLRLNSSKQVRFIFSRSGNEIHQKCMEGFSVQLVNSAQSLLDARNIRLNFGLGLDPLCRVFRDSLSINDGVLLLYTVQ
jgi:hypothetical protein